ncbi:hypothetical protein BofuT4_uP114160.1 [Botrytis cinerea T4]|uniref:Uncharacterized protein n=1 Tax=Botryotinia fuckeliana (strain T4) TaxID=999810 RepID=G2Y5H2_BOTF4|nr:hypothetical protein BofuT4_uP114160.1 [Botrytis cinerea T4]
MCESHNITLKRQSASAHVASDIEKANATVADITSVIIRATPTALGPITGTNPRNQRHGMPKTDACPNAMPCF